MIREYDFDIFYRLHFPGKMKVAEGEKILTKVIWSNKKTPINDFGGMPAMLPPQYREYHSLATAGAISVKHGHTVISREMARVVRMLGTKGIRVSHVKIEHFPRVR